ncbi:hypothetical protein D9757_014965 [Collybiopsis confluens]|uniref:CCHC-type domain-containing protein n=1 Tax=Collybiopsis confluens TaxID=2823264 RepID=A0A8H5CQD8_9AGAR|nr:hypothetical protein D9757_014965 [Collybiopsis confluens]
MSTESSTTYQIDPLHGSANYNVWQIKMNDILTDLGLIKYIESAVPAISSDRSNQSEVEAWKEKDRKALSTIRLRVDDSVLVYIAGAKAAKEAWNTLKTMYEAAGTISIIATRRKLFRTHCAEGADIEEHIRTLHGLEQQLANQGQPLRALEFSTTLLTSLPDSWDQFASSIDKSTITDTVDPDSSKLIAKILEDDLRRRSKNSSSEIALSAQSGKPHHSLSPHPHNKSKFNSNVTCYYCGRAGHIQKECRTRKRDNQHRGKPGTNRNGNSNFGGKNFQNHSHMAAYSDPDYAFIAEDIALPATTPISNWIADSGTTSHLIRDRSAFLTYAEFKDHPICGVGSSAPGIGKGNIEIQTRVGNQSYTILLRDAIHCPSSPFNLLSISKMTDINCGIKFRQKGIDVTAPNQANKIIITGTKTNGLYPIDVTTKIPIHSYAAHAPQNRTWHNWHKIMGHIYMGSIRMMKEKNMVTGMEINSSDNLPQCISCIRAKSHVTPFPQHAETEYKEVGDMTFTDVWGPARTTGIRGE